MKLNAYIFIFTALIYNFIDLGNRELHFISKDFLDDIWYCNIYAHIIFLFYSSINKTSPRVIKFAFRVAIGRFLYNLSILINLIEHTPYKATLFVPCFIVFLALYEKYGWELSLLKRWVHGFITRFFLILFYFLDFQKMVYVRDFEYYKAKGIFMLFSVYFLSTVVLHIYKIYNARLDARIKEESLKAKKELRKYIENKNSKNL